MNNSELRVLSLEQIAISKTNPRKTFDQAALGELTESVKQHGVLQPILVRSSIPAGKNSKPFELVCGERRYRAAITAGLEEIPCNIRVLTDDEAFELQIIENLERKDVHPLEEAHAFKLMLDSERYTVDDIAAKLAKPQKYIVQRLKFDDLIDEIKQEFIKGEIGVGHAVQLARISEKQQKDAYHEAVEGSWRGGWGTVKNVMDLISGGLHQLDQAAFDKNDSKLLSQCGSCMECPKRSGANKLLFADIEDEDICFDVICYEEKLTAHIEKMINKIASGESKILLGRNSYGDVPAAIEEMVKESGLKVLKEYDDFTSYYNGPKKKIFYINGREAGKVKHVALKPNSKTSVPISVEDDIKEQIEKIKEREKRALELDNEKVEATLRSELITEENRFVHNITMLQFDVEMACAIMAVYDSFNYENMRWFEEKLSIKRTYGGSSRELWDKLTKLASQDLLFECLRRLTVQKLTVRQVSDRNKNSFSEAFYQWSIFVDKDKVSEIQQAQDEKAEKRIGRVKERIVKLRAQLKEQKPKKPAKPRAAKKKEKEVLETNA